MPKNSKRGIDWVMDWSRTSYKWYNTYQNCALFFKGLTKRNQSAKNLDPISKTNSTYTVSTAEQVRSQNRNFKFHQEEEKQYEGSLMSGFSSAKKDKFREDKL